MPYEQFYTITITFNKTFKIISASRLLVDRLVRSLDYKFLLLKFIKLLLNTDSATLIS